MLATDKMVNSTNPGVLTAGRDRRWRLPGDMRTRKVPPSTWLQNQPRQRIPNVPVSSEHRFVWGWMRLVLGLTQMAFAATAIFLVASSGFRWRAVVAISVAGVAAVASLYLFAGRPDPRFEVSEKDRSGNDSNN